MNGKAYLWREGSRLKGDPQVVGEALDRMKVRNAESIVKAAKKPTSVLHEYFEWDDKKAAHQHRLVTARHISRSLMVKLIDPQVPAQEIEVRAFPCLNNGDYVRIREVLSDSEMYDQVVARVTGMLRSCENDLRNYSRLNNKLTQAADMIENTRAFLKQPASP
jgi:hypothetical protein